MDKQITKKERFLGCFIGGAVGDALGYPVEFLREKEIFETYGAIGIKNLSQAGQPAVITDDTQMTLFNINGLIYGKTNGVTFDEAVWLAHREWLGTQNDKSRMDNPAEPKMWLYREPRLHALRAPGNTCLSAIRYSKNGGTMGEPVNNSKGCGAIMKAAPFGLLYKYNPECNLGDYQIGVYKTACSLSALTHGHPMGYYSAAYMALILAEIVQYNPDKYNRLEEAILSVSLSTDSTCAELQRKVKRAVSLALDTNVSVLDAIHELGEGWVSEEALYIAVFCAVRYQDDFASAIRSAVNHNGDSDSTGSICGNILGAWLGIKAVEEAFDLRDLEMCELIEEVVSDFYQATEFGIPKNDARWDCKYRQSKPLHKVGLKYTELTKKAMQICFKAHSEQVDKNGLPYVFHPFHLAEQMDTEEEICTALLHDVIEDSFFTIDMLKAMGFPSDVLEALKLLSHDSSVPYMDYVKEIRNNPLARKVKKADLLHNSNLSRLDIVTEHDKQRREKYLKALAILEEK